MRHPMWDYDPGNLNFDVLVMKLETPLGPNDIAQPISYNTNSNIPTIGQTVTGFGMGVIDTQTYDISDGLMEADFKYISNDQCFGQVDFDNVKVGNEILCAVGDPAGTSTCLGDSGGPLTNAAATELLGIISFGSGCSSEIIPNGHVRLSAVADWIKEQICLISDNKPSDCPPPPVRDPREVQIVLYFNHDYFSDETTFSVRDVQTQDIVYTGPQYTPERGESVKSSFNLLPGEYIFEVDDKDNDGISAPAEYGGDGSWKLFALYDGVSETQLAVSDLADFGRYQNTDFTVGESTTVDVESTEREPANPELARCLERKDAEEATGGLSGTTCDCSETGQLLCETGNGQQCKPQNAVCGPSAACCSGRTCRAGYCRSNNGGGGGNRDAFKLGSNTVGGAASQRRSGNLRRL